MGPDSSSSSSSSSAAKIRLCTVKIYANRSKYSRNMCKTQVSELRTATYLLGDEDDDVVGDDGGDDGDGGGVVTVRPDNFCYPSS